MNYATIEKVCHRIEQMIYKQTPEEQQETMLLTERAIENQEIPVPIRTDDGIMAFCLDLAELAKQYQGELLEMSNQQIAQYQEPLELIEKLIPTLLHPSE